MPATRNLKVLVRKLKVQKSYNKSKFERKRKSQSNIENEKLLDENYELKSLLKRPNKPSSSSIIFACLIVRKEMKMKNYIG